MQPFSFVRALHLHCETGACKITFDGCRYPVLQVKLPADAGKVYAGNDCLRFPQVTLGNLPAPVGNLPEAFIVCVSADFLKPRENSSYPVGNTLTEGSTCCL